MTGPEHYREAENLLIRGERANDGGATFFAAAQAHATLALAAAQTNADTIMLCDHGAFPCSRCLNTEIADRLAQR